MILYHLECNYLIGKLLAVENQDPKTPLVTAPKPQEVSPLGGLLLLALVTVLLGIGISGRGRTHCPQGVSQAPRMLSCAEGQRSLAAILERGRAKRAEGRRYEKSSIDACVDFYYEAAVSGYAALSSRVPRASV